MMVMMINGVTWSWWSWGWEETWCWVGRSGCTCWGFWVYNIFLCSSVWSPMYSLVLVPLFLPNPSEVMDFLLYLYSQKISSRSMSPQASLRTKSPQLRITNKRAFLKDMFLTDTIYSSSACFMLLKIACFWEQNISLKVLSTMVAPNLVSKLMTVCFLLLSLILTDWSGTRAFGSVPTTPDPDTSAKASWYTWEAHVTHMGGVYTDYNQKKGLLFLVDISAPKKKKKLTPPPKRPQFAADTLPAPRPLPSWRPPPRGIFN